MAQLGEVAVWSFDLEAWGECTQASDETAALAKFSQRLQIDRRELMVTERIRGPRAVFSEDLGRATDRQIARTLQAMDAHRAQTLALLDAASTEDLDSHDETVKQPAWMSWRTPRQIFHHIADTEARAYPRWCGLPQLGPVDDLRAELAASATHAKGVIQEMPRYFATEHRGEVWTPVKFLRRLAWHERIELIFLRRRLERTRQR